MTNNKPPKSVRRGSGAMNQLTNEYLPFVFSRKSFKRFGLFRRKINGESVLLASFFVRENRIQRHVGFVDVESEFASGEIDRF